MSSYEEQEVIPDLEYVISGSELRVRPHQEANLYTAPEIRQLIYSHIETNDDIKTINMDLSQTTFIDSTMLGVMVGLVKRMREIDGNVYVTANDRNIIKILEITGLDRVFTILPVEDVYKVNDDEWIVFDEENKNDARARMVMRQIGALAGKIAAGAFNKVAPPPVVKPAKPLKPTKNQPIRKSSAQVHTTGANSLIEITNGSHALIQQTKDFFTEQLGNPDIKSITISFTIPSLMEKSFFAEILEQIQTAVGQGRSVRVTYDSKRSDVIPEQYNQLLIATGQIVE